MYSRSHLSGPLPPHGTKDMLVQHVFACIKRSAHLCLTTLILSVALHSSNFALSHDRHSFPHARVLVSPASLVTPIGGLQRRTGTESLLTPSSPTISLKQSQAMLVPDPCVKTELVLAGMAANQAPYVGCAPYQTHLQAPALTNASKT